MTIFDRAAQLNFPLGQYVIVGGSMEAHGIRPAHDIDVVVTPELFKKLSKDTSWEKFNFNNPLAPNRIILRKPDIDILPDYSYPGKITFDTVKIIQEANVINGFPFVKLETLLEWKKAVGRDKDKKDVELISEFLQK